MKQSIIGENGEEKMVQKDISEVEAIELNGVGGKLGGWIQDNSFFQKMSSDFNIFISKIHRQ